MTRDEIIERVARDAWQSFVHSVAWEELPRGYRQGCIVTATRILDAAGYFELREAIEKIAKVRPGEQMETCLVCEDLIEIAKRALGGDTE